MSGKRQKKLRVTAGKPAQGSARKSPSILRKIAMPLAWCVLIAAAVPLVIRFVNDRKAAAKAAAAQQNLRSVEQLLAMPPEELGHMDIGLMNLLCATGLPGAEDMDIDKCLARLDQWAARVKHETERHLYRLTDPAYKEHAEHYKHSEARFRAEWLVTVLQQDIGLHYHPGFVPQEANVPPFKTSKETFLHGLMDNDDAHKAFGGNCVSLPVAYAAVGRRLGYPVKLVTAKEHVFCRWEGLDSPNPAWRERFNFDGAGNGFSIDPDEFYLSWPRKSYPDDVEMCGWLKTLSPQQEMSIFLSARGGVLSQVDQDLDNALVAFAHAARLWPGSVQPIQRARTALEAMYGKIVAAHPEAYRQMVARLDGQDGGGNRLGSPPPRAGGDDFAAGNVPWWKTEAGRAGKLAETERTSEENRRNMQRLAQGRAGAGAPAPPNGGRPPGVVPPRAAPPGGVPSGVPQPFQQPLPGQP